MDKLAKTVEIPDERPWFDYRIAEPFPVNGNLLGALAQELGFAAILREWPGWFIAPLDTLLFMDRNGAIYIEVVKPSSNPLNINHRLVRLAPGDFAVLKTLAYVNTGSGSAFDFAILHPDYGQTGEGLALVEVKSSGRLSESQALVRDGYLRPLGVPLYVIKPRLEARPDLRVWASYTVQSFRFDDDRHHEPADGEDVEGS